MKRPPADLPALRAARAKLIADLDRRKASHARRAKIAAELAGVTLAILRAEIDEARAHQPRRPGRPRSKPRAAPALDLFAA